MDPELEEFNWEELVELHNFNKDMIASLEKDLESCHQQLRLFGPGAELPKEMKILERSNNPNDLEEVAQRLLHNSLSTYERRLKENVTLTGISITDVNEITEVTDENITCQTLTLTIQVLGTKMLFKCEIENNLTKPAAGVMSWFEVQITKDLNDVIGEPLTKLTHDLQMHKVMSLIKSFLQCIMDRDLIIKHFTQAYPDNVTHWIQSKTLQGLKVISKDKRPTFYVQWDTELQENSRYINQLTLQVETSREVKSLDSKGVLGQASEMFDNMVSLLGTNAAIDSFVKMVLTDGRDILSLHELQQIQLS